MAGLPPLVPPTISDPLVPAVPSACGCGGACGKEFFRLDVRSNGSLLWSEFLGSCGSNCLGDQPIVDYDCSTGPCVPVTAFERAGDILATQFPPIAWVQVDSTLPCSVTGTCPPGTVYDALEETCKPQCPVGYIPNLPFGPNSLCDCVEPPCIVPQFPEPPPPPHPGECKLACTAPMILDIKNCKCIDPPMPKGSGFYGRSFV